MSSVHSDDVLCNVVIGSLEGVVANNLFHLSTHQLLEGKKREARGEKRSCASTNHREDVIHLKPRLSTIST
ncbi:hypothetical protein Q5P01_009052 [Channa striata]|uniref:Uncharacterized protein n=1 Tax=Channa striata TaxID=64152 RepID=A0AA88N7T4_CHASR|nr:hypothetical protein Q5P01_009052 [Channa striata]